MNLLPTGLIADSIGFVLIRAGPRVLHLQGA